MNFFSDDFIDQNNARIFSLYEIQPRYVSQDQKQEEKCREESFADKVSDEMKSFLMSVYPNQYIPEMTLTNVCKYAGFPGGTGSRIVKKCLRMNLIKIIEIPFRGRPRYPILLPDAYKILGFQNMKHKGKGTSYEHYLYQSLFADLFKEYKSTIELNRNDKFIDVGIQAGDLLIALEIAMTSVHEKENIEKDINLARADYLIVACINQKVFKEVQDIIKEMPEYLKNKTEVYLISELLKINPDEFIKNHQLNIHL